MTTSLVVVEVFQSMAVERHRLDLEAHRVQSEGLGGPADGRKAQGLRGGETFLVEVVEAHLQCHVQVVDDAVRGIIAQIAPRRLLGGLGGPRPVLQLSNEARLTAAGSRGRRQGQRHHDSEKHPVRSLLVQHDQVPSSYH
jgi:hypothetical protein